MATQSHVTCHSIIKTNGPIPPACIAFPVPLRPTNEAVNRPSNTPTSPLIFCSHRQLPSQTQFTDVLPRQYQHHQNQSSYHHHHHQQTTTTITTFTACTFTITIILTPDCTNITITTAVYTSFLIGIKRNIHKF